MAVITISRQYGSGGSAVARLLAERLTWHLVDNEFVDRVAQRMDLPAEEVARMEERRPSFIERLATNLAVSSPESFFASADTGEHTTPDIQILEMTQAVIAEAVQHGNAVLVGRGAQCYLQNREDVLHVLVVAPREVRVRRVAERLELSERDASKEVSRRDEGRRDYVRTHYSRQWDDPANYHMVINTGFMLYAQTVDLIAASARALGW